MTPEERKVVLDVVRDTLTTGCGYYTALIQTEDRGCGVEFTATLEDLGSVLKAEVVATVNGEPKASQTVTVRTDVGIVDCGASLLSMTKGVLDSLIEAHDQ